MGLLKEANNRSYLTISISTGYGTRGIYSSFLVLGQAPR